MGALRAESGIFDDQRAAIFERDFFGLPGGTLVELVGLGVAWRPFLVEPVQVRFVVGNAPAAFRRRMMKTRSGGGSCRRHGQSGASAIHSLMACQGGSMGSMVSMSKGGGGGR